MNQNIFKQFRERHNMTQGELGCALGIDPARAQSRISHYESNRRDISRDVAYLFIDYAATKGDSYTLEDVLPRPERISA